MYYKKSVSSYWFTIEVRNPILHLYQSYRHFAPTLTTSHWFKNSKLTKLLKSLLLLPTGRPYMYNSQPKEFYKDVQVLGLIQLKQWVYKHYPPVAGGYHIDLSRHSLKHTLLYGYSKMPQEFASNSKYWMTYIYTEQCSNKYKSTLYFECFFQQSCGF